MKAFNRISNLSRSLILLFLTSLFSIFIIELWLKNIPAYNKLCYLIGSIYLSICYASISTFIYYFISQHLIQEKRKVKSYRFINNRVLIIRGEILEIIKQLGLEDTINEGKIVTEEMINNSCEKINPRNTVFDFKSSSTRFRDWHEYLNYKSVKIKNQIRDLMMVNDLIEPELIEKLLNIHDVIDNFIFSERSIYSNSDLTIFAHPIFEIYNFSIAAVDLKESQFNKYRFEYNEAYRKENYLIKKRDQAVKKTT